MEKTIESLSGDHQMEIHKYLKFLKTKINQSVTRVDNAFSNFKEDKLKEGEMYNTDDVETMTDELQEDVKGTCESEMTNLVRMSGVFIQMLLYQADQQDISLKAEASYIENQSAIENMGALEVLNAVKFKNEVKKQPSRLPTMDRQISDASKAAEFLEMKEENKTLLEKTRKLTEQVTVLLKEKKEVQTELETLRVDFEHSSTLSNMEKKDTESAMQGASQDVLELRETIKQKEAEIKAVEEERDKKVQSSTQFLQMKKLVREKNELIKDLRERLGKYEKLDNLEASDD